MKKIHKLITFCIMVSICLSLIPKSVSAAKRFADVSDDSWYNESVYYCAENRIMVGISDELFEPERTITRAEFVSALYRFAGFPEVTAINHFVDVQEESYYAKAVLWGVENKVVYGTAETTFSPDKEITREDIACLIARYVIGIELDFLENGLIAEIAFLDEYKVSDYAEDSVSLVSKYSIMSGNADGTFKPQDKATRAEVASVFMRLQKKILGVQSGVLNVYKLDTDKASASYILTNEDTEKLRKLLKFADEEWNEFWVPEYFAGYELVLDNVKYQFESLTEDPTLPIRCANVYGDVVYGMHNKDGNTLKQVYEVLLEAVK